jgi:hypothetical protein
MEVFEVKNKKGTKEIKYDDFLKNIRSSLDDLKKEVNSESLLLDNIEKKKLIKSRKEIHNYIFSLFVDKINNDKEFSRKLHLIADKFFKNFLFEAFFCEEDSIRERLRNAINLYFCFKNIWENIFVSELWDLIWKENAKKLVLIWFVESYFWELNNNKEAKWIFQFTYGTAKWLGLINNWIDYRNDPIKSARAAAKLLKYNILAVVKHKWRYKELLNHQYSVSYNDILLALEFYNWGLLANLKRFPNTVEEYDQILKELFLGYKEIFDKYYKSCKHRCKLTKEDIYRIRQFEKKYFKRSYSLVLKWQKSVKTVWNHIKLVILQQFKYPWKFEWAVKFFGFLSNLNEKELKRYGIDRESDSYVLYDYHKLISKINLILPKWVSLKLKIGDNILSFKYWWEKFNELVDKIYKQIEDLEIKYRRYKYILYTVKKWDSLWKIWKKFNLGKKWITLYKFKKINWLKTDRILVGHKLRILVSIILVSKHLTKEKLKFILENRILDYLEHKGIIKIYRYKLKDLRENRYIYKNIIFIKNNLLK